MRTLLVGALALALLAASPPSPQHPRDAVAAVASHDPMQIDMEAAPAVTSSPAVHDATADGFLSLKSSLVEHGMSPEVLEAAHGCGDLQAFAPRDLELSYLPKMPAPSWRIVGPNKARTVEVISRG